MGDEEAPYMCSKCRSARKVFVLTEYLSTYTFRRPNSTDDRPADVWISLLRLLRFPIFPFELDFLLFSSLLISVFTILEKESSKVEVVLLFTVIF